MVRMYSDVFVGFVDLEGVGGCAAWGFRGDADAIRGCHGGESFPLDRSVGPESEVPFVVQQLVSVAVGKSESLLRLDFADVERYSERRRHGLPDDGVSPNPSEFNRLADIGELLPLEIPQLRVGERRPESEPPRPKRLWVEPVDKTFAVDKIPDPPGDGFQAYVVPVVGLEEMVGVGKFFDDRRP